LQYLNYGITDKKTSGTVICLLISENEYRIRLGVFIESSLWEKVE